MSHDIWTKRWWRPDHTQDIGFLQGVYLFGGLSCFLLCFSSACHYRFFAESVEATLFLMAQATNLCV
jgi:hypothetical protein